MCSIEDDGDVKPLRHDGGQSTLRKSCVKCGQPGVLITRVHDAFCRSCFQVYVIHKFRAAIGKSKLIREGEHVLLAYSGGANSSALLHLIQDGLSDRAHRKLRFTPTILHVDECGVLNVSIDARKELRQKVVQLMLNSGFPSYVTDLEQAMTMEKSRTCAQAGEENQGCPFQSAADADRSLSLPSIVQSEQLKILIDDLQSVTSQEDVVRNLRNQLIVSIARQLGFTKVLTAECSTALSIRVLSDVAQGRGSQVSLNTAFCDRRNRDVLFIRPIRDLTAKELVMYNSLFSVESVFIPSITTKMPSDSSIQKLTEKFVMGLQADFPSTVANIFRTSEKLESPDLETSQNCVFCQSPLDTNVGKASALYAVEFSQKISGSVQKQAQYRSRDGDSLDKQKMDGPGESDSKMSYDDTDKKLSLEDLNQALCYGCRLSFQDFSHSSLSALPVFLAKEVVSSRQRERLREEISEFLLENGNR